MKPSAARPCRFQSRARGGAGNCRRGAAATYDPANRLTRAGSAGTPPGLLLTAGYTAAGLGAWKESGAGRTNFLYDGALPVVEVDGTGAMTAVNTFGATGLLSRRSGGTSTFYTFDPQGSVAQRLNAAGTVLASHVFDAYGAGQASGATSDPFGYGAQWGYYTDVETGLLLLGHRYYDPVTGRFLNRDPIGYGGGINLYAYVRGNPIRWADPSGLQATDPEAELEDQNHDPEADTLHQNIDDVDPLPTGTSRGVGGGGGGAGSGGTLSALPITSEIKALPEFAGPPIQVFRGFVAPDLEAMESGGDGVIQPQFFQKQNFWVTTNPEYALAQICEEGGAVWSTQVDRSMYHRAADLFGRNQGTEINEIAVPYVLRGAFSDFFRGWNPFDWTPPDESADVVTFPPAPPTTGAKEGAT